MLRSTSRRFARRWNSAFSLSSLKDASGAPLYAPYPLSIAIPAMMIGHLTFAGLAELVLSAGVVAYFQRRQSGAAETHRAGRCVGGGIGKRGRGPSKLASTVAGARPAADADAAGNIGGWRGLGEWSARDLSDPQLRAKLPPCPATLLRRHGPARTGAHEHRLDGAVSPVRAGLCPSAGLGYALSGMFGAGTIILIGLTPGGYSPARGIDMNFLERTLAGFLGALEQALEAEELAHTGGLLQRVDRASKVVGFLA